MTAIDRAPLITSVANPAVKAAAKLVTRKGRRDLGRFLVEGPRAVNDGLEYIDELFVTEPAAHDYADLVETLATKGAQIRLVSDEVLHTIADTVTPQGMIGVAPIRTASLEDVLATKPKLIVALDQVSDPGNAGTILRTADAAGADAVVYMCGSTDPFSPKAIRSSVGSVFHLPIVYGPECAETIAAIKGAGIRTLAAQVHEGEDVFATTVDGPIALIFGGEAAGLSPVTVQEADGLVRIPMPQPEREGYEGHAESLNLAAAAAVMTFTVARNQATA